jgi:cytochrome d ubiquinol oxidase subunit I
MTAELGRQPWLIYGVMRTIHGFSPRVAAGNAWFTLIGFMGMYTLLSMLWLFLIYHEIERGPESEGEPLTDLTSPVETEPVVTPH